MRLFAAMFHGFDYKDSLQADVEKMQIILEGVEFVLQQEDGKNRCLKYVNELSKAFSLSVPHEKTKQIRDDVVIFPSCTSKYTSKSR